MLGAGLFALFTWLRGPLAVEPERIHVDAARIEQLALGFARTWQRPPTQEELAGLVDEFVREEILYREALALGLDRDDTIVRRRMRQKLEFLSEDVAPVVDPDDAALALHLAERPGDRNFRLRSGSTSGYGRYVKTPRGATADGRDNDGDGLADLADGNCSNLFDNTENFTGTAGCGIGPELALLVPALSSLRRRRVEQAV